MALANECQGTGNNTELQTHRSRYGLAVPYGWFCVLLSEELENGTVTSVRRFGREWVIFRNDEGNVGMFEPHCPHLGAHLAIGGKIEGGLLRCPFHNWGFDHQGYCRNIPYASALPGKLIREPALKGLPVVEMNRMIWAWYHPNGDRPLWEITSVPEAIDDNWRSRHSQLFEIRTVPQEIAENSVDTVHLKYVHGQAASLDINSTYDGQLRTTAIEGPMTLTDANGDKVDCLFSVHFEQIGPGLQVVRMERHVKLIMLITITPAEAEMTRLRFTFLHPDYQHDTVRQAMLEDLIEEQIGWCGPYAGVLADLPIWDNKIYLRTPLLCDGDGKIMEFRRWFAQFYA
ncbi:Rieske 2Fe-2S domain-containing protein [Paraburkholderia agricolaris]|uniref:Rieske 2Fe-2S domain-containing protein n=1 Tax=Paraburkholderia agricolaris TaxID=2152888 RepID=UPI0038B990E8